MKRAGKTIEIEVTEEDGEKAIGCNGNWYRSFEDFCQKAETGGDKFTSIYDEFYDVEVA